MRRIVKFGRSGHAFISCLLPLVIGLPIVFSGCLSVAHNRGNGSQGGSKGNDGNNQSSVLNSSITLHKVDLLPRPVQEKFTNLYARTLEKKYLPKKSGETYCKLYFYDYFNDSGYRDLIEQITSFHGANTIEKAVNFEKEKGIIKILLSGFEAQKLANEGRNVGVIGEYFYDDSGKFFTIHYSVVQPSMIAYDSFGNRLPYYVSGLISNRKDVNNRDGSGAFLAQVGVANGLLDFYWAYNKKLDGVIQKDPAGKIVGGIIFVVFP